MLHTVRCHHPVGARVKHVFGVDTKYTFRCTKGAPAFLRCISLHGHPKTGRGKGKHYIQVP